mgnify:CR=1 FL=1
MFSNPSLDGSTSKSCVVFTSVVVFPFNLAVVTDIVSSALARNRTVGLPAHLTIACWRWWCNILLQYSSIFPRDLACHVRNSPIRDLNRVGVDDWGMVTGFVDLYLLKPILTTGWFHRKPIFWMC